MAARDRSQPGEPREAGRRVLTGPHREAQATLNEGGNIVSDQAATSLLVNTMVLLQRRKREHAGARR